LINVIKAASAAEVKSLVPIGTDLRG